MPELRDALEEDGFENVATYLQSGNVVLTSRLSAAKLAREVEGLVAERFGLEIPAVVRTARQIAKVVDLDPLGDVATDPKRYQVSFLDGKLDRATVAKLEQAVAGKERLVARDHDVAALNVRANVFEPGVREQLAELRHGHAPVRPEVDPSEQEHPLLH